MSHANRIREICRHVRGPVVLDLGAVQHDATNADTDNWLHKHLLELDDVEQVVGIDMLESEVETLVDAGYEMVAADVEMMDLSFEADTVVAGELIEHVDNPGLMLDRIYAHLRPGGRLVLSTPNPWAIVHLRRILQHGHTDVNEEHVAWYGPIVLEQLFDRHGFGIVEMNAVGPDHGGLTAWAMRLGYDIFGGNTWVCVARRGDD